MTVDTIRLCAEILRMSNPFLRDVARHICRKISVCQFACPSSSVVTALLCHSHIVPFTSNALCDTHAVDLFKLVCIYNGIINKIQQPPFNGKLSHTNYAIYYYSLIITLDVTPTVFEILRSKTRKLFVFQSLPCLTPPLWGNPLEFLDERYPAKTTGMVL